MSTSNGMENTARNFALQLGALIALYISLTSLLVLLFGVINIAFPDELSGYYQYQNAQDSIRFSIALLVVFFPTYLLLIRIVNNIRRNEHGTYLTLTKWLIYISLLVGIIVLLVDLVTAINTFFNGEITQRFILKAGSVLLIVGGALHYYILDARGYWLKNEKKSVVYAIVAAVVVFSSLTYGFISIDATTEVREQQFDIQQINDLQGIEWRIEEYYRLNETLPPTIDEVYQGISLPSAPEDRAAYQYNITGDDTYELCATFAQASIDEGVRFRSIEPAPFKAPYTWDHGVGEICFERVVTNDTLLLQN